MSDTRCYSSTMSVFLLIQLRLFQMAFSVLIASFNIELGREASSPGNRFPGIIIIIIIKTERQSADLNIFILFCHD
jgi:hypothetical protein